VTECLLTSEIPYEKAEGLDIIWMQLEALMPRWKKRLTLFTNGKADVEFILVFSGIIQRLPQVRKLLFPKTGS
jgi:hypothetical protein